MVLLEKRRLFFPRTGMDKALVLQKTKTDQYRVIMVGSTLWTNRTMLSALDCWWWVSDQSVLCFWSFHSWSEEFFVLLFSIVENASLKKIKCLASNETRCSVTFLNSMDKNNLVEVFTHLYHHHRPHFDHLKEKLNEWIAQHQVRYVWRKKHHTLTKVCEKERKKERFSLSPSKQRWLGLLIIWYERSWEES